MHCGQAFSGNVTVLSSGTDDSIQDVIDCMNTCSLHRPKCYGVAFDKSNLACSLYDAGSLKSNLKSNSNINIVIAHTSQLQPPADSSC